MLVQTFYSQSKKDSLWKVWKNTNDADTNRLVALGQLCSRIYFKSDPDSAIILADMEYDYALKKNLKNYAGVALLKKSGAYSIKGNKHKAISCSQEAIKIFEEINHSNGIASCLNNMGRDYLSLGNYDEAVRSYFKALKVFEKTGNRSSQIQVVSNIGQIYEKSGRLDSAISFYNRCLVLCQESSDKYGESFILGTIGGLHLKLSHLDLAYKFAEKALVLFEELDYAQGRAQVYHNFGKIYLLRSDFKQAGYYLEKSLAISLKENQMLDASACYLTLSSLNSAKGQIDKAISIARKGLEAIDYAHEDGLTYELSSLLSQLFEKKGNYKDAMAMYKISIANRDSTNNMSAKNVLYQEQVKYDFEKKELMAKAENEKKMNDLIMETNRKDSQKNSWLIVSIALLLLVLVSTYFIYTSTRQKNIISDQKNNILKQQLLVSQMSPHFIFNSLNAVQNFIFKQDSYNAGVYLKRFSELIRMILNFSTKDLITLEEEFNFLQSYLELQKLRFNNKLTYELMIDPELDRSMILVPPMLAQPFIENAIEHGIFYKSGEGLLSIKISLDKNSVVYEIEDDGIGLNEALRIKKEINTQHKSLALKITKERIEAMNKQNHTDFEIEIKDKGTVHKDTSGVYVKFAAPYFML